MSPRTGRPKSDNPKNVDLKVRIDEKMNSELISYAKENAITRTEVIRKSISLFLSKEK